MELVQHNIASIKSNEGQENRSSKGGRVVIFLLNTCFTPKVSSKVRRGPVTWHQRRKKVNVKGGGETAKRRNLNMTGLQTIGNEAWLEAGQDPELETRGLGM